MKPRPVFSSLEALESRIAPAVIKIGAASLDPNFPDSPPENPLDTEYVENNPSAGQERFFVDTSNPGTNPADIAISTALDSPLTTNTFFLRLEAGDEVQAFNQSNNYQPLILVSKGNVIAYFVDYNNNNEYDNGELTGFSMGKNAEVTVTTSVRGDIVSNLNENGTKNLNDDTIDVNGLVSQNQKIGKLAITGGGIFGNELADGTTEYGKVLSGGDIKSVTVAGAVGSVLAASAADGATYDFFPNRYDPTTMSTQLQPGGNGTISFVPDAGTKGGSIMNANIRGVVDSVAAGSGGVGANGGSLKNIQITADTDGFALLAGDGGAGDSAKTGKGGTGGTVKKVYVAGVVDNTPNGSQPFPERILISAGAGGDAAGAKTGGKGGAASNIFVGYQLSNGKVFSTGDLLADRLLIAGGAGGAGAKAGNGGKAENVNLRVLTPDVDGEDELSVLAGAGGANTTDGGKAGNGGSLKNIEARNQVLTEGSDLVLMAGLGGTTTGTSAGGKGGSVSGATLLGFDMQVLAGDGSEGGKAGNGGNIKNLTIVRDDAILARDVVVNAGRGGDVTVATGGNGGKGGQIKSLSALSADITNFAINSGTSGDGGNSAGGKGGKGGNVVAVNVVDTAISGALDGTISVRGGFGGSGNSGGGAGGNVQKTNVSAVNSNIVIDSGSGGDAISTGNGGKAGQIKVAQLSSDGLVQGLPVSGVITGGVGGAGAGGNGNGGAGGGIKKMSVNVDGDGVLVAGDGGNGGPQGRAGDGGSVVTSGVFAVGLFVPAENPDDPDVFAGGNGVLQAGSAGVDGGKPAKGGSIKGNADVSAASNTGTISGLRASTDLTIVAGDGSHGGAGGSITGIAYGSTADALTPTPTGNITVMAGNGSAEGNSVGKGGSLKNIFGSVSSGDGSLTSLRAGDGGGSGAKAADGGSISNILLALGGGPGVELHVQAGDGGDTTGSSPGGNGGSVKNLSTANTNPGLIFRSLAAGDGGDGGPRGGNGGSVQKIAVQNQDIGVRTGEVFGFDTMGGIFAGTGGIGSSGPNGNPGNVNTINANAIAAIVAGRTEIPQAAGKLGKIFLNGDQLLLVRTGALNPDGSFDPFVYDTSNLVGAVADLADTEDAPAFVFRYEDLNGDPGFQVGDMPIDGLIIAQSLDQKTINFIPEAKLVAGEFFDSDNTL